MVDNTPQMRRIPDEQFFDLRNWSADKAEDYGESALNNVLREIKIYINY